MEPGQSPKPAWGDVGQTQDQNLQSLIKKEAETVDVRFARPSEAHDFTPWLGSQPLRTRRARRAGDRSIVACRRRGTASTDSQAAAGIRAVWADPSDIHAWLDAHAGPSTLGPEGFFG